MTTLSKSKNPIYAWAIVATLMLAAAVVAFSNHLTDIHVIRTAREAARTEIIEQTKRDCTLIRTDVSAKRLNYTYRCDSGDEITFGEWL